MAGTNTNSYFAAVLCLSCLLTSSLGKENPNGCEWGYSIVCYGDLHNLEALSPPSNYDPYNIHMYVENFDYPLTELDLKTCFVKDISFLNIKNSSIGTTIYKFRPILESNDKLRILSIVYDNIESINLSTIVGNSTLQMIFVADSGIKEIEVGTINANLNSNLSVIDLTFNRITDIPERCFVSFRNSLKRVRLNNNIISNINVLAFEGLNLLETLYLSHNNIKEIGLFLGPLKNLVNLDLNDNQISKIEANNFINNTLLEVMSLHNNQIASIDDNAFEYIPQLWFLTMNNNSINCLNLELFKNNLIPMRSFRYDRYC